MCSENRQIKPALNETETILIKVFDCYFMLNYFITKAKGSSYQSHEVSQIYNCLNETFYFQTLVVTDNIPSSHLHQLNLHMSA